MLSRFATLAAVCMLAPVAIAPLAQADPPPPPDPAAPVAPPVDNGIVASAEPGVVTTPDGWKLTVAASNESQLPIAPLTTAASSREYLVAGTFTGTVGGSGETTLSGGTLDTGYQIGCGIDLGQVRLIGSVGLSTSGSTLGGLIPTGLSMPLSGTIEIHLKPGTVNNVSVNKKSFKAAPVRVTLKDVHIKLDGCVGQSFLRSYATLTSSTTDTDDIVAYYGVTKSV
ncbi:MspA family porin [Mycolicibacterium sp. HK-90]|uniref:MspA family porin n=1 Tax=Mycolicibacterium sp. HK-90 TaxID=3056937 RepID=UPI00265A9ED3|nr:MspA family porin [Mycolicibacterium sp. HK-90]WKG01714.1 MspA family porin [Mycolicibacterium sp. HK-90]